MKMLRALLVLGRVSNLPTIWSNCLCGWLIGVGLSDSFRMDWAMFVWLASGATAMYLGGMVLNDACDVAFDREHRPERPIPSGAITEKSVWYLGIGLLAAGTGLLAIPGGATALLALALFNCILLYNFIHKQTEWSPGLIAACRLLLIVLAACFAFGTTGNEATFFAHIQSGAAVWTALVLFAYVTGLSCLAKVESAEGPVRYWPCALLALPVGLALMVNVGDSRKDALLVGAILVLWVVRSLRSTFWAKQRNIGRTVGGLLAGIVLVDLLAVAQAPTEIAAVFLGLFVLALAAQKWVPAT
ncbi:MAG: UbiA family prenyltransferase [Verrucomicrobia subdivision 3 bacterium]|nr:UbiA family prenyltransferase [Limisphaerales bacterium]